jgi:hypothetical protein
MNLPFLCGMGVLGDSDFWEGECWSMAFQSLLRLANPIVGFDVCSCGTLLRSWVGRYFSGEGKMFGM